MLLCDEEAVAGLDTANMLKAMFSCKDDEFKSAVSSVQGNDIVEHEAWWQQIHRRALHENGNSSTSKR